MAVLYTSPQLQSSPAISSPQHVLTINTVSEWNHVQWQKCALSCVEFPRTSDSGAPSRAAGKSIPLRDVAQRLSVLHHPVKKKSKNESNARFNTQKKVIVSFVRDESLRDHVYMSTLISPIWKFLWIASSLTATCMFTNCNSLNTKIIYQNREWINSTLEHSKESYLFVRWLWTTGFPQFAFPMFSRVEIYANTLLQRGLVPKSWTVLIRKRFAKIA